VEALLVVVQRPHQHADADDAGGDQHHRGIDGVARQGRLVAAAAGGEHHRQDQRHLDDRDRERQHQRAERLAHPVRDHLGMVHGRRHRPHQRRHAGQGQHPT
jgi:hypothetical protein